MILSGRDKKFFSLPFLFGLVGWILAKLSGQKWIYFWSCGYVYVLPVFYLMAFKKHEYSRFIWFALMGFSTSQVHGVPLPGDSTQFHGRISYITATVRHRRWSCAHYILPQSTLTECIAICECLATIVSLKCFPCFFRTCFKCSIHSSKLQVELFHLVMLTCSFWCVSSAAKG